MKKQLSLILLLVLLQSFTASQTKLEGSYNLTSHGRQEYFDEFIFSGENQFKFSRKKHLANECGFGEYTITDSLLTLVFREVPVNFKDSLRSYYLVIDSKRSAFDTSKYVINIVDHNELPVLGASAQLVDENGFSIVEKIKKYWEVDAKGEVIVQFPASLKLFGIKIAIIGYETLIIPVKKDTNQIITVKMLEQEKCVKVIDEGTIKKFYIKNIRYSGFYIKEDNTEDYKYYKKEKE